MKWNFNRLKNYKLWFEAVSLASTKVVFSIVITAIMAVAINSYFPPQQPHESIVWSAIVTLFLALVIEIVALNQKFSNLEKNFEVKKKENEQLIDALLDKFNAVVNVSEKRLIEKTSGSFRLIKYCTGEIENEKIPEAWMDLCWDIQTEYLAINYEKNESAYDEKWARTGIDIQNAKARMSNVKIKKVFVVDDISELVSLKGLINKHIHCGIEVSYITISQIGGTRGIRNFLRELPSLDFSIVNGDTLFIWNLNEERKCENGELSFNQPKLETYRDVFFKIHHQAEPLHHICDIPSLNNKMVCELKSKSSSRLA